MQRDYMMLLFETTMGQAMVVTAVILQIIGVFWIRKIINIDI